MNCDPAKRHFIFVASLLGAVLPACLGQAAQALELSHGFGLGLGYSDNIKREPANPKDEWARTARAGITLQEKSRTLEGRINADVEYRDYKNDTFVDDTQYTLSSGLKWHISPDRFSWTVEDYFSQRQVNSLQADTPANRQDTNVFTTGPDYIVRISAVNSLEFAARFTRNTYSETANTLQQTQLDNSRNFGSVKWAYQMSATTALSLNLGAETVNYDDEVVNTNFRRRDAFLQINNGSARSQVVLDLGATEINRDSEDDVNGSLARLSWTRRQTTESTFAVIASRQLSDVGSEALTTGRVSLLEIQPTAPIAVTTGDVFVAKRIDLAYTHRRVLGTDRIQLFAQENDFEISPLIEKRKGGTIEIGYDFSDALTGAFSVTRAKTASEGAIPNVEFTDKNVLLRVQQRITKTVYWGLELGQNERDSATAGTSGYREKRGLLTLSYTSVPAFRR